MPLKNKVKESSEDGMASHDHELAESVFFKKKGKKEERAIGQPNPHQVSKGVLSRDREEES